DHGRRRGAANGQGQSIVTRTHTDRYAAAQEFTGSFPCESAQSAHPGSARCRQDAPSIPLGECDMRNILRVTVLVAAGISLATAGCCNACKDQSVQSSQSEHPKGEHPKGEHPKKDQKGEHPKGEHPKGEHPKGEHPK